MDNNIVDINYNLKTLLLTDTNDENNKVIKKVDKTFMNIRRVDVSLAYSGSALTAPVTTTPAGTTSFISLTTLRGFQPSNIYGFFYVSSSAADFLNKNFRALCLDNDYNEFWQYGTTNATNSEILVQLPLQCRGINKIELLEPNFLNTAGTAYRFLLGQYIQTDAGIPYYIRYTAIVNNREYFNVYTVPKGKKARLINIDNYYNTNAGEIQQIIFKKQSTDIIVNTLFSNATFFSELNMKNNNWCYEGDVIMYNSNSTGSTNMLLNTSYEIKNI